MFRRQVSLKDAALLFFIVLAAIYALYWRRLVYQPPQKPPGMGGGGPPGGGRAAAVGREDVQVETLAGSGPRYGTGPAGPPASTARTRWRWPRTEPSSSRTAATTASAAWPRAGS